MMIIAGSGSGSGSGSKSGSVSMRHGSADPDPPKMSWIRNTDLYGPEICMMHADPLLGQVGGGWALESRLFGPQMALA
jgi:hypothetical protein